MPESRASSRLKPELHTPISEGEKDLQLSISCRFQPRPELEKIQSCSVRQMAGNGSIPSQRPSSFP
jgi:hypothetical protein